MTDTELLNWLGTQGNGWGWAARPSTTGRGYRLHQISQEQGEFWGITPRASPREAIQAAMELRQAADRAEQLLSVNRQTEDTSFG